MAAASARWGSATTRAWRGGHVAVGMLGGGTGGAAGEGAAVARKFGDGGHGGFALVRPERERESEKGRVRDGAALALGYGGVGHSVVRGTR